MKSQLAAVMERTPEPELAKRSSEKISNQFSQISDVIARRAFDIFESRGRSPGHEQEDWFRAESELLRPVPVNVAESDGEYIVRAEVPGFGDRDIEVIVEPSTVALRRRKKRVMLQVPSGLVVCSDDEVRQKLAQVLRQCALAPVLASTVAESGMALAGHEMLIVVCDDRLDDGKYEDIVKLVVRSEIQVPVIVISRTGDWPEYLIAMCGGAFDYLAYPPIPGDLQQTIQNALLGRRHLQENGGGTWASNQ